MKLDRIWGVILREFLWNCCSVPWNLTNVPLGVKGNIYYWEIFITLSSLLGGLFLWPGGGSHPGGAGSAGGEDPQGGRVANIIPIDLGCDPGVA
jgi:hypothetical protein